MSEPKPRLPDQVWLLQVEPPGKPPELLGTGTLVALSEAAAEKLAERDRQMNPGRIVTAVRVR